MRHAAALPLCALIAVCSSSPAAGKGGPILVNAPSDIISRRISYADLNLASASGEKTLVGRVRDGVDGLCNDATGGNDGSWTMRWTIEACDRDSWGQARPQIKAAVQRAREIALTGKSSIVAAAIVISANR